VRSKISDLDVAGIRMISKLIISVTVLQNVDARCCKVAQQLGAVPVLEGSIGNYSGCEREVLF
jgi:hypothetical protein